MPFASRACSATMRESRGHLAVQILRGYRQPGEILGGARLQLKMTAYQSTDITTVEAAWSNLLCWLAFRSTRCCVGVQISQDQSQARDICSLCASLAVIEDERMPECRGHGCDGSSVVVPLSALDDGMWSRGKWKV